MESNKADKFKLKDYIIAIVLVILFVGSLALLSIKSNSSSTFPNIKEANVINTLDTHDLRANQSYYNFLDNFTGCSHGNHFSTKNISKKTSVITWYNLKLGLHHHKILVKKYPNSMTLTTRYKGAVIHKVRFRLTEISSTNKKHIKIILTSDCKTFPPRSRAKKNELINSDDLKNLVFINYKK